MKKKLLVLNTDPMNFSYGGVCPFMRNMHSYLAQEYNVDYIVLPDSWKRFPSSVRLMYIVYLWLHRKSLKKFDFIFCHCPEGGYMASFSGVPYAYVYHGNSNPMAVSRFKIGRYFTKIYERILDRINDTSSLIYTVGQIRNPKQKKLFNPLKQDVLPLAEDKKRGFVFAGRLEKVKNIDHLITIYSKLPNYIRKNNPFYIIGYGTLEGYLKNQVKSMGLENQVVFLGKVDNSLMLKTEADKKIMIMASSTEGFPTAIAEALSVGVPVVSTNVGDISLILKDGVQGKLLPLGFNDEDYIKAIMDVLDNYDIYSKAAYNASSVFNGENITKGVIKDINMILRK